MLKRCALVILVLIGSVSALRAGEAYLFDLLKQPSYLSAWKSMLAGENVPKWVANYAKTFDGPSSPAKEVSVGAETYTLGWVCKAHDCGDNQIYVLFAPGGGKAWGLLVTGGNEKWLGGPDAAIQAAIKSGME
jgi:hypothetical protein